MADREPAYGDEVVIPWGLDTEVRGTVHEVYGSPGRHHVVVLLTPELSDSVVAEPATVAMPLDSVKRVEPAA